MEARVSSDRWLVSYADLLTLLFALFAVLVALSHQKEGGLRQLSAEVRSSLTGGSGKVERNQEADHAQPKPPPAPPPAESQAQRREQLGNELRSVLAGSVELHQATVVESPEGIVVSFDESGLFASGEAELLPGKGAAVLAAGRVLAQHGAEVRVEGHSDDQPIQNARFSSNWELSAARAMAVLSLLVREAPYDPTHLSMAGYGPYRPVADNSTPEGRRKNRRVDLVVLVTDTSGKPQPERAAGGSEP